MALACGHTAGHMGVISVPVGRKFAIQAPVDCWISITTNPAGDAAIRDFSKAWIVANVVYVFFVQAASAPVFLSGLTVDPNGDVSPTSLTFIDSGTSGI